MRLLVTGGAGYIGSIVAQQLVARGDDVTVLDSLYRGHRAAVPEGAAFVEADLLDPDALAAALAGGFDGVVHFAALSLVAESVEYPERYWRGNVVGALNLLDAMRAAGVPRLVFSSTAATYGEPDGRPDHRGHAEPRRSTRTATPSSTIDRMLADEARAHGLAAVSLRYFNVAGASGPLGEDHTPETHLIPLVLQAAAGQARERRDLRHRLPDAGRHGGARLHPRRRPRPRAPARARKAVAGRHDIYNLGSATGYSVREVIEAARARDRARDRGARGGPPRRAIRRGSWPPARRRGRAGLGARSGRSRTWSRDAWEWHQAHPDGY